MGETWHPQGLPVPQTGFHYISTFQIKIDRALVGQSSLIFAVEPGDRKGRHYISALKPIWPATPWY